MECTYFHAKWIRGQACSESKLGRLKRCRAGSIRLKSATMWRQQTLETIRFLGAKQQTWCRCRASRQLSAQGSNAGRSCDRATSGCKLGRYSAIQVKHLSWSDRFVLLQGNLHRYSAAAKYPVYHTGPCTWRYRGRSSGTAGHPCVSSWGLSLWSAHETVGQVSFPLQDTQHCEEPLLNFPSSQPFHYIGLWQHQQTRP